MSCLLLCLAVVSALAPAQEPWPPNESFGIFRKTKDSEGLLNNTAVGIVQDHGGFIWIAGYNSLFRYDGFQFLRATEGNADTVLSRWIYRGLAGGRHGILCVFGYGDELVLYHIDRAIARLVRLPSPPTATAERVRVSCAVEDSRGRFWVGTSEGYVYRLDPASGQSDAADPRPRVVNRKCDGPVRALAEDSRGNLWMGGEAGVVRLGNVADEGGEQDSGSSSVLLPPDSIGAIVARKDGTLWVATVNGEFGLLDPGRGAFSCFARIPGFNQAGNAVAFCEDSAGSVWLGDLGSGLVRWRWGQQGTERYLNVTSDTLGRFVAIPALYVDRSGLLWVCTHNHGILTHAPWREKFHSCTPSGGALAGLSGPVVSAALRDRRGNLWVGTFNNDLNYLPRGSRRFQHFVADWRDPRSLGSNNVTCICERRNGELWFGTVHGGVSRFQRETESFSHLRHSAGDPGSLGEDIVTAMFEEKNGTLWVGHSSGVDRFDDRSGSFHPVIRWPEETVFLVGTASHFFEDRDQNLWVATYGRGLLRLSPDREDTVWYRRRIDIPGSLPDNTIAFVCEDRDGRMWLGTPVGLVQFDKATNTFRTFPIRHPSAGAALPAGPEASATSGSGVLGIIPDQRGNLWLSTTRGIVRFNTATAACRTFGRADGVAFEQGMRHAMFSTPEGYIYCGGIGGLSWFHPDSMVDNQTPPPVVITEFRVFEDRWQLPVRGPEEITLDHRENTFSFEFAALDFTDPEQNQFMYMLEGADHDWVSAGTDRQVTYANVSPGDYVLRVRASNSDGIWNEAGLSIGIVIHPPYWRTWWFRTFVVILVGLLLYAAYRYRLSRLMAVEKLRLRIAQDLHDDIGSALSGIALTSEQLARRLSVDAEARSDLERLKEVAIEKAEGLRDLVWTINPRRDASGDLVVYLKETAHRMLTGMDVQFTGRQEGEKMTLEVKHNVTMIFREIVQNILRHSRARRVEISVTEAGGVLRLRVADDGVGFDAGTCVRGNGLQNLEQRARAMGGTLQVRSSPGAGTIVDLRVKIT